MLSILSLAGQIILKLRKCPTAVVRHKSFRGMWKFSAGLVNSSLTSGFAQSNLQTQLTSIWIPSRHRTSLPGSLLPDDWNSLSGLRQNPVSSPQLNDLIAPYYRKKDTFVVFWW